MDFRPFFNTMLWCDQEGREPKQIADWIRASEYPIDAMRGHFAYVLAVAALMAGVEHEPGRVHGSSGRHAMAAAGRRG